ncbi:MAG: hypothetical protein A2854_02200 [Parcubacteria group bacterium RIFCSPHIGHO2_01_FULL_56_18]|nr:MAG: hypothetical protein A2854_02200 [Parcubacteria group bacterium RIFCSPHIGHO2_01_FULL_56_18]
MSKTLSIIIPTYNRAELLRRILEQLTAQSRVPDEIIIIDDHSTDHTRVVAREFLLRHTGIRYALNSGHHLAAARQTGLELARSEYMSFIDDDVIIEDTHFFAKLYRLLQPDIMIQPKVIMENFGQRPQRTLSISDVLASRPYPILELITARLNRGTRPRPVFPFNELGVFWHRDLNSYWIDHQLIGDAYGQSFSTALRLREAGVPIIFRPELLLRHPGAPSGGSKKFNKKLMTKDFTAFHYDYFYNLIYLNSRWFPRWIWLWLPYFLGKSLVALAINRNRAGWRRYAVKAISTSLQEHFFPRSRLYLSSGLWRRSGHGVPPQAGRAQAPSLSRARAIFIWQGAWQGGAERITLSMAQYLAERGHTVTLGVFQKNAASPLPQIQFRIPHFIPTSFRPLAASLIFRLRHARQFSAVYTHKIGWWKTAGRALFVHEAANLREYQLAIVHPHHRLAALLWRWLYVRLTLRPATLVFAATAAAARYLRASGIAPSAIKPSASFFDENIFHFVPRMPPKAHTHLVFIGNPRDPRKNFSALQKLFYNQPHYTLHIAGSSTKHSDKNFIDHGYLTPSELFALLSRCHVLLHLAQAEGFSVALLEALATGIPCLALASAVNQELSSIKNVILAPQPHDIPAHLTEILRHYARYNVPDHRLKQFTHTAVLDKEYEQITTYFAAAPASRRSREKKAFSETG